MRTSGHGNDAPLILVTVGVGILVGVYVLGGPAEAFRVVNELVRSIAVEGLRIIQGLR